MRKKIKILLTAICVATLLGGCTKSKEPVKQLVTTNQSEEKEDKRQGNLDALNPTAYRDASGISLEPGSYISIIGKTDGTEFWEEVEAGAKRAEEDLNKALGYKGEDKIKVNFSASSKGENVEEQVNILDEELARNPAAVGIAIIDANACEVQFDLATENGIPIVAFDSGSNYQGIQALSATNNDEVGRVAARKLGDLLGGSGKVAVFVHDTASTSGQHREGGFLKEIETKYPDMEVPIVYHLDDLEKMAKQIADEKNAGKEEAERIQEEQITQTEVIQYLLEKNPDLKGCYATNEDVSRELLKALEVMGKDIPIIAVDGGKEQLQALEDGKLDGLIVQNPYGMGYAAVISAARASLGLGNEAFIDTGFIWVTKDNMEDKSISKMLY